VSNIVPIGNAQAPMAMRQRFQQGTALNNNFSDGVRDAFPILSIKGKVFRARVNGQEQALIDPASGTPVPYLDVVLVNASKFLAKSYYAKGFTEGDFDAPTCWSLDSIRPDASVVNKVSPVCGTCPMNAFGSKITESGKAAKACQDARRVAVVMPHMLSGQEPLTMLLRVPQSSLKNLKNYAQMLERHQFEPNGCVTRLAFDYQEAYPKLLFNFVQPLDDATYQKVVDIAESPQTASMLQAPDFDMAASTGPVQDQGTQHTGLGGLAPQAGPVLAGAPVQAQQAGPVMQPDPTLNQVQPQQTAKPDLRVVQPSSTIITLPDGKRFDTSTGQYVEETPKQAEMPELDPATVKLPDGKYFNTATQAYVSGPEKGAGEAKAEAPLTRQRRTRKSAEQPAQEATEPAQASPDPKPEPEQQPAEQAATPNGHDKDIKPAIAGTPPGLDEILRKLMPTT